jgi:hypothetical protein
MNKDVFDNLTKIKTLGSGAFGTVYLVKIKNNEYYQNNVFALKREKILAKYLKKSKYINPITSENKFYKWITTLKNDSVYFMKRFQVKIYDECNFVNSTTPSYEWADKYKESNICMDSLLDLKGKSINELSKIKTNLKIKYSLITQFLYLNYLMRMKGWIHNDCHNQNIMFERTDKQYKTIKVQHRTIRFKTNQYQFSLIDYGMVLNKKHNLNSQDKKMFKINYEINNDLWIFLNQVLLDNWNIWKQISHKIDNIDQLNLIKTVKENKYDLYNKIKGKVNLLYENGPSVFRLFEKTNYKISSEIKKKHQFVIEEFFLFLEIYNKPYYCGLLNIQYYPNLLNEKELEMIRMNCTNLPYLIKYFASKT